MSTIRVAAIVGSLRADSINRRLLDLAISVAPDSMEIVEASIADLPLYNEDLRTGDGEDGYPEPVQRLRRELRAADAVLICSPEYNYSVPAPLKNAIDWASRGADQPFRDMPVAVMGASGGKLGTARMQYHLRQSFVMLDAHVLNKPEVMVSGAHEQLGEGKQPQELTTQLVGDLLTALEKWTRLVRSGDTPAA